MLIIKLGFIWFFSTYAVVLLNTCRHTVIDRHDSGIIYYYWYGIINYDIRNGQHPVQKNQITVLSLPKWAYLWRGEGGEETKKCTFFWSACDIWQKQNMVQSLISIYGQTTCYTVKWHFMTIDDPNTESLFIMTRVTNVCAILVTSCI